MDLLARWAPAAPRATRATVVSVVPRDSVARRGTPAHVDLVVIRASKVSVAAPDRSVLVDSLGFQVSVGSQVAVDSVVLVVSLVSVALRVLPAQPAGVAPRVPKGSVVLVARLVSLASAAPRGKRASLAPVVIVAFLVCVGRLGSVATRGNPATMARPERLASVDFVAQLGSPVLVVLVAQRVRLASGSLVPLAEAALVVCPVCRDILGGRAAQGRRVRLGDTARPERTAIMVKMVRTGSLGRRVLQVGMARRAPRATAANLSSRSISTLLRAMWI